jgi:hypothetical protein
LTFTWKLTIRTDWDTNCPTNEMTSTCNCNPRLYIAYTVHSTINNNHSSKQTHVHFLCLLSVTPGAILSLSIILLWRKQDYKQLISVGVKSWHWSGHSRGWCFDCYREESIIHKISDVFHLSGRCSSSRDDKRIFWRLRGNWQYGPIEIRIVRQTRWLQRVTVIRVCSITCIQICFISIITIWQGLCILYGFVYKKTCSTKVTYIQSYQKTCSSKVMNI